jgi:pilus assembly protein CpaC
LAQILAEPNLTALSGHPASFLAGGEFPIPVPQSTGTCSSATSCAATITIMFKKFGVRLNFTPTIVSSNRISLLVRPEVSQLTQTGSITLDGFTIPGIETRQAQTTVELASGQSFAIAGLLQNDTNENVAKYPGLGDLPILGALFRSTSFQRNQSELVVIVTPYIVRPTSHRLLAPTDGLVAPNDVERIFGGITYHREPVGAGFPPPAAVPSGLKGPVGFQLE